VYILLSIVLGSIWGSFANVCIHRLPKEQSVVKGRSYCPSCEKEIKWFDNIPVISFIFLRAKCRNCKEKIKLTYFIVEILSIFSFFLIYYFFGLTITTLLLMILSIFFIIIFFIDLKHFIIPNELTFPLMVIGFVKSFDPNLNQTIFPNYINSLIGGISGYLIIWLIIFFYKKVRKKEGMGLGDAKLLAAIGFWFGWASIPFVLFFSSIIALISTLPSLIKETKNLSSQIPFGPYIILATVLFFVLKQNLILVL
tara:strand:- start:76 stop:837 length:762 start_codon:yes stop_codon:yes gene_type:complete